MSKRDFLARCTVNVLEELLPTWGNRCKRRLRTLSGGLRQTITSLHAGSSSFSIAVWVLRAALVANNRFHPASEAPVVRLANADNECRRQVDGRTRVRESMINAALTEMRKAARQGSLRDPFSNPNTNPRGRACCKPQIRKKIDRRLQGSGIVDIPKCLRGPSDRTCPANCCAITMSC
jgi:hypothetical protein